MDKLIVITPENNIVQEVEKYILLFENGLEFLHLRKPHTTENEVKNLLQSIPTQYLSKVSLHDHFQLATEFPVGGLHLNARNSELPKDFKGRISCSCHSIAELETKKPFCRYLFLSPIYNSLSKSGYSSNFLEEEIIEARERKIIDSKTMALGGVVPEKFEQLKNWGFGGVALLGYIWENQASLSATDFLKPFLEAKNRLNQVR